VGGSDGLPDGRCHLALLAQLFIFGITSLCVCVIRQPIIVRSESKSFRSRVKQLLRSSIGTSAENGVRFYCTATGDAPIDETVCFRILSLDAVRVRNLELPWTKQQLSSCNRPDSFAPPHTSDAEEVVVAVTGEDDKTLYLSDYGDGWLVSNPPLAVSG
jgi:hypothetical protein